MEQLSFSIPEILSLFGTAQCVYVLVYMAFRSGNWALAGVPFVYFFVLGAAFFFDASTRFLSGGINSYENWHWAAWFAGPPLSVLLIVQIAQVTKVPSLKHFWVLLLIPFAFLVSSVMSTSYGECETIRDCQVFQDWLVVAGLLAGGISLLAIWFNRDVFKNITGKEGKERYWLIFALIAANVLFLAVMLVGLSDRVTSNEIMLIRTVLGLAFVYLASTSLFRIYPQSIRLVEVKTVKGETLSSKEQKVAQKIEVLLDLDKVYHEPTYGRADLARELEMPESTVSKIINTHFGKSFPQLLNERRIADAKRLLKETDVSVKIIASEVGFNSLPSFNRAFKDIAGITPSAFRKEKTS